ncbi:hypothetical protein U3516DRAFT_850324 [Neocallimastix sp. 'constans']
MKLSSILSLIGLAITATNAGFDRVGEDGKRYIDWGANYWEAMNLGASNTGNHTRLIHDLN